MADSAVKVAVRVRPFNAREKSEGAELCVSMEGNMTKVFNQQTSYEKEFFFDYSYWSHDGFVEDPETGILNKDSATSKYADQQTVFEDLGVGVLNNAWEGYNCCLFAYGQTGSGKSYSMVGYGPNKGIIPIACEEIFKRISGSSSPYVEYKVSASMVEIYNEQVQDLLQPPQNRVKGGLRIREDPKQGVFVDGMQAKSVGSYEEISAVLDLGNKHRTVAATQMNATSSRAHTVLTIDFTQIFYDEDSGKPLNRKQSKINLVDLAGSERASKTGAAGDRLQEGSNINKSLSTLGKVITALAKRGSGKLGKGEVIPYRESKLTRILQNALGGNSKTTMIAAISPATFNFEETLSTLRYADAVKSIKNQAVVNETPQEKLIRELKEENEKLKALLEGKALPEGSASSRADDEIRRQYEQQIEELRKAKEEAEKTWQERANAPTTPATGLPVLPQTQRPDAPHLSNLNEDPLLSGYIRHVFKPGANRIGKKNPDEMPDIVIEGLGIGINHCTVILNDDEAKIIPSQDPNLKTMVNGKLLTSEQILENQDRVKFGNHNFFLYIDPEEISNQEFDWEYAVNEANAEQVKGLIGNQDEELKAQQEEMKKKLEAEWEEARQKMEEERKQLEELLSSKEKDDSATRKALAEREGELIARQRAMEEEMRKKEASLKAYEENRLALERLKKLLTHAIQQINEANERAVLLGKSVIFQPELYREKRADGTIGSGLASTNVRIKVVYPELSDDIKIHWSLDKLEGRLIDMQEICNQLSMGASPEDIDVGYDPFADKIENIEETYQLIGHSYIYLDVVYYLMGVDEDYIPIIDDRGSKKGSLRVALKTEVKGMNLEDYDNLKELLNKNLDITLKIVEAVDIPENYSTNMYCAYNLTMCSQEEFTTEKCMETTTNPQFNYTKVHSVAVTPEVAEDFLNHALAISVFGDITQEKKQEEINKLKHASTTNYAMAQANIKANMDLSDIEEEEDQDNSPLRKSTTKGVTELKSKLEQKEELIQKLKAEQLQKEEEYNRKMREIEEKEKKLQNVAVAKRGSCACIIF